MKLMIGLLLSIFIMTGCTSKVDEPAVVAPDFTAETLAEYNGMDGQPAYIAIDGQVYNVTDHPMWMAGLHQGRFQAGQDLTEQMKQAPHGFGKLEGLEVMGSYE